MIVDKVLTVFLGSKAERDIKNLIPLVQKIGSLEPQMMALPDEEFPRRTARLRERYRGGESLDALLPEAFALVREAARRTLGERLFDVQLMGGIVLHQGKIMEMKTGEGKTLSSVTAAYLNSLTGDGRARGHGERLPGRARRRLDGADLPLPGGLGGRHPLPDGQRGPPRRLPAGHHLRDEQRVRLRLPARQHVLGRPRQGAARPQLLHRRRDRLHPDRRGPHPAHHLGGGRGRHRQDLRGQQAGRLPGRVREGPRDRTTTRSSPRGTTRSRRRTSGSPSPTRG